MRWRLNVVIVAYSKWIEFDVFLNLLLPFCNLFDISVDECDEQSFQVGLLFPDKENDSLVYVISAFERYALCRNGLHYQRDYLSGDRYEAGI